MIFTLVFGIALGLIVGLLIGYTASAKFPIQPRTMADLQVMLPKAAIESVSRREYNDIAEEWQDHDELVIYTGWDADDEGVLIDYQAPAR